MLIEQPDFVSDEEKTAQKKAWQTPQCSSKRWKTPRLSMMPFNETQSADVIVGPETSVGVSGGHS